ncbi:mycothiol conjugate amidase Mca [Corynebacterium sp. zg254]|uniref:Mycothiol S-conjugate amidase n=2 Tax=Corynebacteriaceae TaxID=1653 RepID=A0ABQ6VJ37_9CORY|nr:MULTISPECIES: mycothiol conjugate amidase Mca [Corynebacterium]KAB3523116.1 mycothiol conjugate amidase Mca [Corynebacterium zhongnanshanii]MCR5913783.1 mycothiol conjugate amidase Mca [Corynebacterium sp. zg254]
MHSPHSEQPAGPKYRVLAIHAHPDDESSKGAATMARYVDEGHRVKVLTCTGGERGDILNPYYSTDGQLGGYDDFEGLSLFSDLDPLMQMRILRQREMADAVDVLGVEHEWLGYVDSGLPEGDPLPPLPEGCFALQDPQVITQDVVKVIRTFRPHVIITYDENGGYPHPDHLMVHAVSMEAWNAAADPTYHPELGEAWEVSKLYYTHGFVRTRFELLTDYLQNQGVELSETVQEHLRLWQSAPDIMQRVTTQVPVGDWFERRDDALRAHGTQIDPEGAFLFCSADIQRKVWPTEEFELARSRVGELPQYSEPYEHDLFEGLEGVAQ